MTKLLTRFSVAFLALASLAGAQSTVVSGTIVDPLGNTWSAGTVTAVFEKSPFNPYPPTWSGGSFNPLPPTVNLDSGGNFTITLPSNTAITPSGSKWNFSVCPNATQSCAVLGLVVSGSTLDMEAAINNANAWPTDLVHSTPIAKVYNINQTFPPPLAQGGMLYDTTTQTMLVYTNTGWQPFATVGGQPIVSNPTGTQTITQPINTNFNFNTSGTGGVLENGNQFIYNNFAGAVSFLGTFTVPSVNNVIEVDGIKNTSINSALAMCPATGGCVIDARGGLGSLAIGTFDPGTKSVTLLLGPYTYSVTQITLRTNFHLIGTASVHQTIGGTFAATVLQSTNVATSPIVLPGSGQGPAQFVELSDLSLLAATGNTTENGIDLQPLVGGGLWQSTFSNLMVQGFVGTSINIAANNVCGGVTCTDPAVNQFLQFHNVYVSRPVGGIGIAIIGNSGQITFDATSQVTYSLYPTSPNPPGTNVLIAQEASGNSSATYPYDVAFRDFTNQGSARAFDIEGASNVVIENNHFEECSICTYLNTGPQGWEYNVRMDKNHYVFGANDGVNSGAGALAYAATANNSAATFSNNSIEQSPDAILGGISSGVIAAAFPQPLQNFCYFGAVGTCGSTIIPALTGITSTTATLNLMGDGNGDLYRNAEAVWQFGNQGSTLLQGGGSTSAQGALLITGSGISSVKADNSGYLPIFASSLNLNGPTPAASSTLSNYSIPIMINGVTYYMRLSSTP